VRRYEVLGQAVGHHRDLGARYLRDNIKYYLGADERAGLDLFYRYAAEVGVAPGDQVVRFY